jgi:hypothetical protein
MKTTAILDLMVKDHIQIMKYIKDVENNLGKDFGLLSESFNTLHWNLEKHFFVEERAIFASYKPEEPDKEYAYFSDIMNQHTGILEKIESLRKKLQARKPFDLSETKNLLIKHKTFEEKHVYPILDQEIDEREKRFIIDRINEII